MGCSWRVASVKVLRVESNCAIRSKRENAHSRVNVCSYGSQSTPVVSYNS